MPSWFTTLSVGQIITFVGGLTVILGVIVKIWKTIRPVWRGVVQFLEDWRGEPGRPEAGVPERPGVMKRLATIEAEGAATAAKVDKIDHEVHPNSGSSLRDQVDNLTKTLDTHIAQQQG